MKSDAGQFKLRMAKPRTDGVFKRKESGCWQARVWIGDKVVRRSTGKRNKSAATDFLPLLRDHLNRKILTPPAATPLAATQLELA
jgi:hypothetical protein